jgi:zinc D-Ala-D-Ala dipeptidase
MRKLPPVAIVILVLIAPAFARDLPEGFAYLRDVAPAIAQEIRYASYDNFTGRPLPGYAAGECVLRREVAQALARVEAELAKQNLGLKVYDCYRPTRAVRAMWRWSNEGNGGAKRFYPHHPKDQLFSLGYIATHSRHSTGNAVDLTLIKLPPAKAAPFERDARYGPCTAPAAERAPDNTIDMGTGFDCLDEKSTTRSSAIAAEPRRWRLVLNAAMRKQGFFNYPREWWHYSFGARGEPAYDFPIEKRK